VFRGFAFLDSVTCPCSLRSKRHDNLFVYDDDDDDDDDNELKNCYKIELQPIVLLKFTR